MTAILGISAFYHDSAAAIVVDGVIVAAAQEERFTRNKHDEGFPKHAIEYCLSEAGISASELDYVGFYEKPLLKFDRLLETYFSFVPSGYSSFRKALPVWLRKKLYLTREMNRELNNEYQGRFVFAEHHESHAASAFFPSPFDEAAIITIDGVGEWTTTAVGLGQQNKIQLTQELRFPHSLGLLYSAFTYYAGFRVNSGEYKIMGLAPYGKPVFRDKIFDHLIDLKQDGSFRLNMEYFNYCQGLTMTSPKFHDLFGGPPRLAESKITQTTMDLAASIQSVTEEAMLRLANHAQSTTGMKNLVLAGGVALNCVGNGRVLRESEFDNVWIQPAAGDAGGALGTALFIWHQLLNQPRHAVGKDFQQGSLLGPSYDDSQIQKILDQHGSEFKSFENDDELCKYVAQLLCQDNVIGWFQGRMEFGPRALGARSILGDARSQAMQSVMNQKIKFRESFRPFAPLVLRDRVDEYFEMRPNEDSPYMLLVAPVCEGAKTEVPASHEEAFGVEKLHYSRSVIPAVTHVDYSARVQTVDKERNPLMSKLLTEFDRITGCPVLINTSFNVRSEPIVCTPEDAIRCFEMTEMDVLVLGRNVLLKNKQQVFNSADREKHLAQFQLD